MAITSSDSTMIDDRHRPHHRRGCSPPRVMTLCLLLFVGVEVSSLSSSSSVALAFQQTTTTARNGNEGSLIFHQNRPHDDLQPSSSRMFASTQSEDAPVEETLETTSERSMKQSFFTDIQLPRLMKATTLALLMTTLSTIPLQSPTYTGHANSAVDVNRIAVTTVPVANAAGYESLSPEQKFVAEAWRTVDSTFLDRTFAGQDWFKIRQDLVKKKYKSMDEAQQAVADMMSLLGDKYTRYLTPAKYQSLVDSATGTLAGIGVEIATTSDGYPVVGDVEPGSPASKGGVMPKDIFVESDGTKFDAKTTPDDVALKLRGPVNSKVGLTVSRNGQEKEFILTRQPIQVTSVRSYMGSGKVGVIRIKNFSATTGGLVKDAMVALQKQGAKSFLFDLRGNPGGLLPGGVETASLFLESNKPVVFVVSNKGVVSAEETFSDGVDTATPVTILVDHNTASAAEVFTAALKENGRAKVVGEQTFGKGIIQTIRELSDQNGGVAVTVARYETPQHNDINKAGIAVDEPTSVDCAKDDATACVPSKLLL
eukprot:CAMPEP_0113507570 /NCGR_PEP_ID=MMETSP0014_2-20120614/36541_1 /TAXON_ID=2857 /ORGANISM="Nitzschia sp." /LENGTH=538 /DNA_ID=CAMNT_0000403199 /DNA_START=168 /DNA_END=1784 /DNA_ORIENTATION=+ /assembly_acc=CAM_ASM_000159